MTAHTIRQMRELDSREIDGLHVRLLWSPQDDRTTVAVRDDKTGDAFVVHVPVSFSPLEVFRHPYAFAAWRSADDISVPIDWLEV